ncbi:MAG: hypothetical protein HRT47_01440 [Candidatus Caenarcaniphilales bacterium]|nr:hypothetical protein [Candidatus Caenarcaniphilales bacterium]
MAKKKRKAKSKIKQIDAPRKNAIDPVTASAIAGTVAKGVGGAIDAAQPEIINGIQEQDIDRGIDFINDGTKAANDVINNPASAGGVNYSGGAPLSKRQIKEERRQAFKTALEESGQFTDKQIRRKVRNQRGKYRKNDIFTDAIESGRFGNIYLDSRGRVKVKDPEFNVVSENDELKDNISDANEKTIEQITNLTDDLGEDLGEGIDFRKGLRDFIQNEIFNGGDYNTLSAQDEAQVDAIYDKDLRDSRETFRNDVRNVMGDLSKRGFSSSSLTRHALQNGAIDAYSRNTTDAASSKARNRQSLINARNANRAQHYNNILNSSNTLGATNLSPLNATLINPGSTGAMTDAESANLIQRGKEFSSNIQYNSGRDSATIATKPRLGGV